MTFLQNTAAQDDPENKVVKESPIDETITSNDVTSSPESHETQQTEGRVNETTELGEATITGKESAV